MDGELVMLEEAKIHIMTSSLHYGLTPFEGIRAYSSGDNLYLFRLEDHIRRLFVSARIYSMKTPFSEGEMSQAIIETIKANDLHTDCYIRPFFYVGFQPTLAISKIHEAPVRAAVIAHEYQSALATGEYKRGLKAIISSWRRPSPDSLPQEAKFSANFAVGALAQREAMKLDVRYAFMLDQRGFLSEGSGQNIFTVKGGELLTPSLSTSLLPGITRRTLLILAKHIGYPAFEREITRGEIYGMDEIFVCGTGSEVRPVLELDGIAIGNEPGPITLEIASNYYQLVTGKIKKFRKWLTLVY